MRISGILMPVTSLPGRYGVGSAGQAAYDFIDFLHSAGQRAWQVLPLGPTGYGDSPYQSFSAFAANPYIIDIDMLCEDNLLTKAECKASEYNISHTAIDYKWLYETRFVLLKKAVERFDEADANYISFCENNKSWLDDYAIFMSIKNEYDGVSFLKWDSELRLRKKSALERAELRLKPQIRYWKIIQFLFYKQWAALKSYANSKNVKIIGDIPIYVSPDSTELWTRPELFQTDLNGNPTRVAGCPPDAFSSTGQLWGNPLYNWQRHESEGFSWWLSRLTHAFKLYDIVRIDHFRGFEAYYSIDAKAENAMNGYWEKGPGKSFIKALHSIKPKLSLIAEDLGFLTPDVRSLLKMSGYPGMKVLQFGFDSGAENDYLPHNYYKNCVVYTGTHDNTTTPAWQNELSRKSLKFARDYLNTPCGSLCRPLIRAALSSVADTAIIPLADWLELSSEGRINLPSTLGGNWVWRAEPKVISEELKSDILTLTQLYGRT